MLSEDLHSICAKTLKHVLLLFDIDGTLLRCGGAGRAALNQAFLELYGLENVMDGVRLAGGTDYAILDQIFQIRLGRAPKTQEEIEAALTCYFGHLENELLAAGDRFMILPGAVAALDRLDTEPELMLGLATGNHETGARIKLRHGDLSDRFEFGGFGSVKAGISRANQRARAKWGREFEADQIFVIGDTEFDVRSAHELGLRSIGVTLGSLDVDALSAEKPNFLVKSLEDPQFWAALGLDGT